MRDSLGRLVDAYDVQQAGAVDAAFAAWEPWQPEVGQRVRVRLSGECRGMYWPMVVGAHPAALNGQTGHVYGTWNDRSGHTYLVILDTPIPVEDWPKPIRHFQLAAIELEPLDAASDGGNNGHNAVEWNQNKEEGRRSANYPARGQGRRMTPSTYTNCSAALASAATRSALGSGPIQRARLTERRAPAVSGAMPMP